jgi:hypothetical protein
MSLFMKKGTKSDILSLSGSQYLLGGFLFLYCHENIYDFSGESDTPSMGPMSSSPKFDVLGDLQVRAKYPGNGATSLGSSLHRPLILWKLYLMAGGNNVLTYGTSKTQGNTRKRSNGRQGTAHGLECECI